MIRAAAIVVLLVLVTGGCGPGRTVEQQVIGAITEMEEHGEEGRRGAFMDMVHESFAGQLGGMTREDFRRFMIMQWNRNQRLQAQLFPIRVTDHGDGRASANFKALITGGRGWLPERGQLYDIHTEWIETGGDWMLIRAAWSPLPLEEAMPGR